MKKIAIFALAAFALASCNNETPKVEEKTQGQQAPAELKIAYVEVDSLMTQYTFCKEQAEILEKKSQNIQNTLNQKTQSLQSAAAKFQQDVQNNKYTQQQAEAVQASLMKQQNDLQALQQRLGNEFQAETEKFNVALHDSLQHFLAQYNKTKKYSLILTKQGDNILYADKSFNITNDVIAGLNKAYKPGKKEEKKEEKK
ncbi:MAG: OmpH family outer membrane protein [Prevotella sp.]|nr:OmpH family outer membrane protein [Prevotella sp.]MBQ9651513.1 OmpH family outer membrane protein [Prevotella sp.]